ncbi:MAG: CHAT domain-containing protein [Flavobacteriales bacterium]|nr:CHAT domain-containing protein [Flavobacteriales bacterium]
MAQKNDALAKRHVRISELYEAEKYAETIREIDLQVKEAAGTPWQDSLFKYLYKYGRAHRKMKDAQAGAVAAEHIQALVKERGNANHELEALFDLSWYYYDIGEMKQCARVDSLAVTVADGDPVIPLAQRGRARQYLAFDHSVLGDHRNSAKWALAAIAQYEQADSIPPTQWAESWTAAGVANWHMGRIRDAERFYLKALGILGDGEEEDILIRKVSTNGNLGVLWQNAGDFTRAKNFYHASLRCSDRVIAKVTDPFKRDEAIVNRSRTYLNLATVYHQLGDHGHARELMDLAWRDRSGVLEPDDPQLLVVKDRQADLELSIGELDKAEALTMAYLAACERKLGRKSEEYIRAASRLGSIAEEQGLPAKADSLFALSIAAGKANTDEATDAMLVQTLQSRARMHMKAKRFKDALEDLQWSRRIQVNIYDSAHYKVAEADTRLAELAWAAGDARSCLFHARSAMAIIKDRVRAAEAGLIRTFPEPHILPDAVYWKVLAERALAASPEEQEWDADLDLAISALTRDKSALEDELSKLLLIGAQQRLFDLAMDVAYDVYLAQASAAGIERFLFLAEADRSTVLKSRLNAFAGIRFSGVPDSVIAQEQELLAALAVDANDRNSATDLDKHERAYAGFMDRLRKDHPVYFALRYDDPRIGLKDLRSSLVTPDRDLLLYAYAGEHLYMMVVRTDTVALIRTEREGIGGPLKALNAAVRENRAESFARLSAALYDHVFGPVAGLLRKKELLIVPDGDLQTLNFEVLMFEGADRGKLSDHMLIQKYAIAYLLSATTAVQFSGLREDRSNKALALAPGFSDDLKEEYIAKVGDSSRIDHQFLNHVRQPFALSTAEGLGDVLSAKVVVGGEASEKSFRDLAKEYGILHLGTHAEMNERSPMYSRLVLSKDGAGVDADADGYLHAYEIYELDLRAQLAVLTACETGIGKNEEGEGVRSLGYSFAYAGCPSLVTSLWSIDEKVSSEIITRFYVHLAGGMPKHQALRQAKLDHLNSASEELAMPYYWAGMVLVGDTGPIQGVGTATRYLWWILGGLGAIGLIWWWRRRS